jgi:predicted phosphodiesterase
MQVARTALLVDDARVRVAAIYDIHGNLPALGAALAEIDGSGADLIVVGGDVAWGPLPRETVDRLVALGSRACFVRGDADRDVLESLSAAVPADPDDPTEAVSRWCAEQLSGEQREFLSTQADALVLDVDGLGPTLFCHGSPRSDRDRITVATAVEKVIPMVAGVSERVIVCGHTHAQFDRSVGDYRVVNAGSVGLQFGERGAHWTLLGPDVEFRRSEYDYEAAATRILATSCPVAATFAERVLAPPPASTAVERWG